MARLKACAICGRIHSSDIKCRDKRLEEAHRLRQTNSWKSKSTEIRDRSFWLCAVCLDRGVITHEGLEVHHIEKLKDRPDLLTADENLICLCSEHHKQADAGEIEISYLKELARLRDSGKILRSPLSFES